MGLGNEIEKARASQERQRLRALDRDWIADWTDRDDLVFAHREDLEDDPGAYSELQSIVDEALPLVPASCWEVGYTIPCPHRGGSPAYFVCVDRHVGSGLRSIRRKKRLKSAGTEFRYVLMGAGGVKFLVVTEHGIIVAVRGGSSGNLRWEWASWRQEFDLERIRFDVASWLARVS